MHIQGDPGQGGNIRGVNVWEGKCPGANKCPRGNMSGGGNVPDSKKVWGYSTPSYKRDQSAFICEIYS